MKGAWQSDWQKAADEAQGLRDRITELEKALRQIAIGADPGGLGDGLTYAEIQSIANGALAIKVLP